MATVTFLGSVCTTAVGPHVLSATPTVGDLIVIVGHNSGQTNQTAPNDNANDGGIYGDGSVGPNPSGKYFIEAVRGGSADCLIIAIRDRPFPRTQSTNFSFPGGTGTGGAVAVFAISGVFAFGNEAVRRTPAGVQVGLQNNVVAGNTPAPAFPAPAIPSSIIIGAIVTGANPTAVTAPAGYTNDVDTGYVTPTIGFEVVHLNGGETNQTITWGSANPTGQHASVIMELDTGVYQPQVAQQPVLVAPGFVGRQSPLLLGQFFDPNPPAGPSPFVDPGVFTGSGVGVASVLTATVTPATGAGIAAGAASPVLVTPAAATGIGSGSCASVLASAWTGLGTGRGVVGSVLVSPAAGAGVIGGVITPAGATFVPVTVTGSGIATALVGTVLVTPATGAGVASRSVTSALVSPVSGAAVLGALVTPSAVGGFVTVTASGLMVGTATASPRLVTPVAGAVTARADVTPAGGGVARALIVHVGQPAAKWAVGQVTTKWDIGKAGARWAVGIATRRWSSLRDRRKWEP